MSVKNNIRKIEHGDGITVVDRETGATGEGETYPDALEDLVERIKSVNDTVEQLQDITDVTEAVAQFAEEGERMQQTAEFVTLTEDVQERFDDEGVSEEDIENAIEWARSQ